MTERRKSPRSPDQLKPLGFYPWDVNDYRASRNAQNLPWEARAILRELLDEIWLEGSVPDDPYEIAAIARVPIEVVAKHWQLIRDKMLTPIPGMDGMLLTNRRLEIERTEADRLRVARQAAGRKGGLAKAGRMAEADQTELALPGKVVAVLSNAKHGAKQGSSTLEEKRREENSSRPGPASAPEGALAAGVCQWCGVPDGHSPDCWRAQLRASVTP